MKDPFSHLVITRRRKKYKFAHFENFANTADFAATTPSAWQKQLADVASKGPKPLVVELAAGTAQFSLEHAKHQPRRTFVAVDIKSDRLYTSAKAALDQKLQNILFLRLPITKAGQYFKKQSITELWLTFPDPHPKKRSAKHRLTHTTFLRQYRDILKPAGTFHLKTDNRALFQWSLEQLVADTWHISELSFDLHASNLPLAYKVKTVYEQKFMNQGLPIYYLSAQPGIKVTSRKR